MRDDDSMQSRSHFAQPFITAISLFSLHYLLGKSNSETSALRESLHSITTFSIHASLLQLDFSLGH